MGHRPSGWRGHHSCRLRARRAAPPRAAHPGSRRHCAPLAHRRDDRCRRRARRPRIGAASHRARPRRWSERRRRLCPYLSRRSSMCKLLIRLRSRLGAAAAFAATVALTAPAHAAGSSMPWEQPLQQILESIEGPVAKIIAVIIIIVTGLTLAFGDTSGGFRRLVQIVFGLSIAFAASSFFLSFFSFGGGAVA